MALFYFTLKAGRNTVPDHEGQELADESEARLHAAAVSQQLMRNREVETRLWRIQVSNDYLQPLFDVLFAEVDETIAQLPKALRISIENAARTAGALNDALVEIQTTLGDVRQTLRRADRILSWVPKPSRS